MPNFDFEKLAMAALAPVTEPAALPPATVTADAVGDEPKKRGRKPKVDGTILPMAETGLAKADPDSPLPPHLSLLVNARAFKIWISDAASESRMPIISRQFPIESDEAFCNRAAEAGYRYNETVRMNTLFCSIDEAAGDVSALDDFRGDEVQVDTPDSLMRKAKPGSRIEVEPRTTQSGYRRFVATRTL